MFAILKKSNNTLKFPVKMAMMSVISRMMGRHKLILMNFYPFVARYLIPHHKEIHKILAYLAESVHNLVPA
jgi:protein SDA1